MSLHTYFCDQCRNTVVFQVSNRNAYMAGDCYCSGVATCMRQIGGKAPTRVEIAALRSPPR